MADRGLFLEDVRLERVAAEGRSRVVLDDLSAHFAPGSLSLVRGPTGSGKSTLLGILGGLLRPTAGVVRHDGEPVSRWSAAHRDRWRRRVGIAFQRPALLDGLTSLENVMVPKVPSARRRLALRQAATEALEAVSMAELAGRVVESLSGGERQRVACARALIGHPDVLLLDEPTAHQDDHGVEVVMRAAGAAALRGAVVIVASHDPRFDSVEIVDAHWELREGRLRGSA